MSAVKELGLPTEFVTKIVGVSFFPEYPHNIFALANQIGSHGVYCELTREPNNPHDSNSICVDVNGKTIGRLPRLISMILAQKIDAGEVWFAEVGSIIVSVENANQPGIKLKVWRQDNVNL